MPYLGETCAVATATLWALSGTSFAVATRVVGGFATNQFRIWAAVPVLACLVFAATGALWPAGLTSERGWLLVASGLIGLVLGDLGYFHALATIGPRLASVLMATWPMMAFLFEPLSGETVELTALPGVLLTVGGVVLVLLRSRDGSAWNPDMTRRQWWTGISGALFAALGQAIGVLLARRAMAASPAEPLGIDPLAATFVRMLAAVVGVQLIAVVCRKPFAALAVLRGRKPLLGALGGTLCGPVLGVWMSMMATRHSSTVGIAAALMATTPLFMMPIAVIAYRARIGLAGVLGTLLSVSGVAWLFVV